MLDLHSNDNSRSLPVELLLIIFNLVYSQETVSDGDRERLWKLTDVTWPSLFPYAIAAVCTHWWDVMSSVPAFWTRIVIVLDSHSTILPMPAISMQIAWSRDLYLTLVVTRRTFAASVDVQHERAQIRWILRNLLNPNIHRLRRVNFNATFRSSLPLFPDNFRGSADMLTHLALEYKNDDGTFIDESASTKQESSATDNALESTVAEQDFPVLSYLIRNGSTYFNQVRGDWRWMADQRWS